MFLFKILVALQIQTLLFRLKLVVVFLPLNILERGRDRVFILGKRGLHKCMKLFYDLRVRE